MVSSRAGSVCVLSFFFFFWPSLVACGILVPRPGIKPVPPAVEVWSLHHWTSREVPPCLFVLLLLTSLLGQNLLHSLLANWPSSFCLYTSSDRELPTL